MKLRSEWVAVAFDALGPGQNVFRHPELGDCYLLRLSLPPFVNARGHAVGAGPSAPELVVMTIMIEINKVPMIAQRRLLEMTITGVDVEEPLDHVALGADGVHGVVAIYVQPDGISCAEYPTGCISVRVELESSVSLPEPDRRAAAMMTVVHDVEMAVRVDIHQRRHPGVLNSFRNRLGPDLYLVGQAGIFGGHGDKVQIDFLGLCGGHGHGIQQQEKSAATHHSSLPHQSFCLSLPLRYTGFHRLIPSASAPGIIFSTSSTRGKSTPASK